MVGGSDVVVLVCVYTKDEKALSCNTVSKQQHYTQNNNNTPKTTTTHLEHSRQCSCNTCSTMQARLQLGTGCFCDCIIAHEQYFVKVDVAYVGV